MSAHFRNLSLALLLALPIGASAAEPTRVTPTVASPLAAPAELIERQFSPLEAFQLQGKLAATGLKDPFHIDLSSERLLVRAPAKPAADGRYGLLVFVDSISKPRLDTDWNNVLDAHHVVLVSPENAGDDALALDRRIPLALHAYEYARRTYNIDPDRVYVAGRDGGARVAQRLAFSYPDVFSGAIINAGADALGTGIPVPSADLLRYLRTRSTLVFATSRHDQPAFSDQRRTLASLRAYCIAGAAEFENGHTIAGHAGITGLFLSDFLGTFETPRRADPGQQSDCEQDFGRRAASALANIRQLEGSGRRDEALKALVAFDHAYGRLLLEDELSVAKQLNPAFFGAPSAPASGAPSVRSH